MERKITGFHLDEVEDWVAELDCGHGQHVRHKPPFFNRPWTQSEEGRDSMLGSVLNCVRCDQLEFPEGLCEYKRTPVFTETTIPAGLLKSHSTGPGVWGLIHVLEGKLLYTVESEDSRSIEVIPGTLGVIAPRMKHHIQPAGRVRCCVAFHKRNH